jgi:uncharacterized protein YecT (DUF1311 family)
MNTARLTIGLNLFVMLALTPPLACAQYALVEATMESVESVAFGECWWLAEHAEPKPTDRTQVERQCRDSLAPKIVEQRRSLAEAEKQLATEYTQLSTTLKAQGRIRPRSLLLSQRNWAKFRDSHCTLEVERVMGNYRSPHRLAACLEVEATKRINYLKGFAA